MSAAPADGELPGEWRVAAAEPGVCVVAHPSGGAAVVDVLVALMASYGYSLKYVAGGGSKLGFVS